MPANKNKPLLERAKTVIRGLLRVESRKATDGGAKSLAAIEQALTSFAERLYLALAPRVRNENPFLGDLKEVDRLTRIMGDQIDHETIKIERAFVRKYMRVFSYYKIDSLVHQFTTYYRLEVPRADSSSEVRQMYRETSDNLRSSLEAAHASLLNDIRLSIESAEKKYLNKIADSFASAIRYKYEELSKRSKENAKAGLPHGWGFGTNYDAARKKKNSCSKGPKYENATLQNSKQKHFSGLGEKQRNADSPKASAEQPKSSQQAAGYQNSPTENKFSSSETDLASDRKNPGMTSESAPMPSNNQENSQNSREDSSSRDDTKSLGSSGHDNNRDSGSTGESKTKRSGVDGIADSIMEEGKSAPADDGQTGNGGRKGERAQGKSHRESSAGGAANDDEGAGTQADNSDMPHSNAPRTGGLTAPEDRPEPNLNFGSADEGVPVIELFDSNDDTDGIGLADGEPGSDFKSTGMFAIGKDLENSDSEDVPELSAEAPVSAGTMLNAESYDGGSSDGDEQTSQGAGNNEQYEEEREDPSHDNSVSETDADSGFFWPDEYFSTQRYAPENFGTFVDGYAGRRSYDIDDYEAVPKRPDSLPNLDKTRQKSIPDKSEEEKEFEAYFSDLAESVLKGKPSTQMFSNPGNDEGTALAGESDAFMKCLTAIDRSPGLKKLLEQLGTGMGLSSPSDDASIGREPERRITGVPENISGITLGNEIEHLLPQEIVNLSVPGMDALFAMRYAERGLMRFDVEGMAGIDARGKGHKSSSPKGRGPVVMCVDTSSSMRSGSDVLAKATVMSIAGKCLSSGRDCYVINFSVSIEKMLLRAGDANAEQKLKIFLSKSFDGGSDLDQALMECLSIMRNDSAFFRSDVLCLTDGQIKFSVPLEQAVQRHRQKEKNKFYEVVIGAFANESYWIDARQRLREQASLFDRLFELSRDGMRLREITELDYS